TAAVGRTADLRALIDLRNQGNHGLPSALKTEVSTIPAATQVWIAFTGGLQSLNFGVADESNAGQAVRMFRGVDSGTAAINLQNGFRFAARLQCKTPNDAKHLRDAVKGLIGFARLSTRQNQPDLFKLYDAVQANNDGSQVEVTAQVPPGIEDKFLDLWLKRK
ncbi:MAG: hypothetical protein JO022_17180, partial [Acidobacteriaceae bacterium]|nr:hypothetical protein [Acidobacteriaceae bacterium]